MRVYQFFDTPSLVITLNLFKLFVSFMIVLENNVCANKWLIHYSLILTQLVIIDVVVDASTRVP